MSSAAVGCLRGLSEDSFYLPSLPEIQNTILLLGYSSEGVVA